MERGIRKQTIGDASVYIVEVARCICVRVTLLALDDALGLFDEGTPFTAPMN